MKTRNTLTKLITITMAVAALGAAGLLCGTRWLQPVEAQSDKDLHITSASRDIYLTHLSESSPERGFASVWLTPQSPLETSPCRSNTTWRMGATLRLAFPFMNRN